jgi:hypothetical protein
MTVRSLPITIGDEDLELRFDQSDVIRAEIDYKVGYVQFFQRSLQSLSLFRMLFYYGLKVRTRAGTLERRCASKEEAGELVSLFLSEHYPDELVEAVYYSFVCSGWLKEPTDTTSSDKTSISEPSKN